MAGLPKWVVLMSEGKDGKLTRKRDEFDDIAENLREASARKEQGETDIDDYELEMLRAVMDNNTLNRIINRVFTLKKV